MPMRLQLQTTLENRELIMAWYAGIVGILVLRTTDYGITDYGLAAKVLVVLVLYSKSRIRLRHVILRDLVTLSICLPLLSIQILQDSTSCTVHQSFRDPMGAQRPSISPKAICFLSHHSQPGCQDL